MKSILQHKTMDAALPIVRTAFKNKAFRITRLREYETLSFLQIFARKGVFFMQQSRFPSCRLFGTFARYVSLNVLSMLGLSLYILADTYFIANSVGSEGIVALNIILPAYSLIDGLGLMLGIGGATRFSIAHGEGQPEKGSGIFSKMFCIGLSLGILFTLAGILAPGLFCSVLGAAPDILPLASEYFRTMLYFSPAFLSNSILIAFVRNDGAPNLATAAMLTGSISNIFLDYLLMYPLGLGMFGAALATGVSPVISLCILSLHFLGKRNSFSLTLPKWRGQETLPSIAAGIPSLITSLSSGLLILLFNKVLLGLSGNTAVAAYSIISNIALVCIAIFNGVSQGVQPLLSRSYGAGETRKIIKLFFGAAGTCFGFGIIFFLCGLLFPDFMIAAFNRDSDEALRQIAGTGIPLYFLSFLLAGVNIVCSSLFACTSQPRAALTLSLLRGCIAVVPLILLFAYLFGLNGVWLSVPTAELLTFLLGVFFIRKYWKSRN